MRSPVRRAKRIVHTWQQAQVLLERWRKNLTNVLVELTQPRVIDVATIDFVFSSPRDSSPFVLTASQMPPAGFPISSSIVIPFPWHDPHRENTRFIFRWGMASTK